MVLVRLRSSDNRFITFELYLVADSSNSLTYTHDRRRNFSGRVITTLLYVTLSLHYQNEVMENV